MGGAKYIATMDDWMRDMLRRVEKLERRKHHRAYARGGDGWVQFADYTPGQGVTVSTFDARVTGGVFFFRLVATIASLAVPTNGDVANTTVAQLAEGYRPARIMGGIGNGGVGRSTSGIVTTTGAVQLSAMTPDATQTASVTLTNAQISLSGSFPVG